jgi:signal transduction histidine kinase
VRHSEPTHLDVRLHAAEAALCIDVTDDGGAGQPWIPGVGLASMRERVDLLGGQLRHEATPTGGMVSARLPLADPTGEQRLGDQ